MMLLRGPGRQVRTVIRAASQPHSCFTVRQLKEDCVIPGPCLPNLLCISNRALYGYILLPVATSNPSTVVNYLPCSAPTETSLFGRLEQRNLLHSNGSRPYTFYGREAHPPSGKACVWYCFTRPPPALLASIYPHLGSLPCAVDFSTRGLPCFPPPRSPPFNATGPVNLRHNSRTLLRLSTLTAPCRPAPRSRASWPLPRAPWPPRLARDPRL